MNIVFITGFYIAAKIGIEIAKEVYCYKSTDKSGTFAF